MKKNTVFVGIFLLFFFFGSAFNQEFDNQVDVEDQEDLGAGKVMSISPAALTTLKSADAQDWSFMTYSNQAYIQSSTELGPRLHVPINLPNGAVVTKLTVFIRDNNDTENINVYLIRTELATSAINYLGSVHSSGLASSTDRRILKDSTINYAVVKNHRYTYHLEVRFGFTNSTGLIFFGAKINYL